MKYISTRGQSPSVSAAEAIIKGLAPDGGLYVPEAIPALTSNDLLNMKKLNYQQRAQYIMSCFLPEFSPDDLAFNINSAYNSHTYDDPAIAPLRPLSPGVHILELWHGPTAAFKDMALQMLPRLHALSVKITGSNKQTVILVATSGDTGKAALEGFKDVNGTQIIVFYPRDGVSEVQKQQMLTQEGKNVCVAGVIGNFDDAQTGVKRIFNDPAMVDLLAQSGLVMSSANSINWGRLLPQIVYYVSAYVDLMTIEQITTQEPVNFTVPTGNFGNILAAYYASRMGIPVHKLICASNANNVLTDFLNRGFYDRRRQFYQTISPSMDILISSNLERLLFEMTDHNADQVRDWMQQLSDTGYYQVNPQSLDRIQQLFVADYCSDDITKKTIQAVWSEHKYLLDTHTAVAVQVNQRYQRSSGDKTATIIVATASPFKFTRSVAEAVLTPSVVNSSPNEFELLKTLASLTKEKVPYPLQDLDQRQILHTTVCEIDEMPAAVMKFLGL